VKKGWKNSNTMKKDAMTRQSSRLAVGGCATGRNPILFAGKKGGSNGGNLRAIATPLYVILYIVQQSPLDRHSAARGSVGK
jgi:hypothetical protein